MAAPVSKDDVRCSPMGMTSSSGNTPAAEINVTPLIDVLLVLLIIFMVIQPTAIRGFDALVPQPPKSPNQAAQPPQPIVVEILTENEHGVTYRINATSLLKADMQPRLTQIFGARTDKAMFIKGDAELDFSLVVDVIDSAHQAGVNNIGIITPRASNGAF